MKAIIFDFNGTLFRDYEKNNGAWVEFSKVVRGYPLTWEEMEKLNGLNNRVTLEAIHGAPISDEQYQIWSDGKEEIYRQMCRDDVENLHLTEGAPEIFDFVVEHNIKHAIASMAGEGNINFYKEQFGLLNWFSEDLIIYDKGQFPGKPDPTIFIETMKLLNVNPSECVIVEDSAHGLTAAHLSGAGKVIAIGDKHEHEKLKSMEGVDSVITNFFELDRSMFAT